jgi:hypothetical protein
MYTHLMRPALLRTQSSSITVCVTRCAVACESDTRLARLSGRLSGNDVHPEICLLMIQPRSLNKFVCSNLYDSVLI